MRSMKMQILVLVTIGAFVIVSTLFWEDAGAKGLSDRQMSRILGKAECYCQNTGPCGPSCQGDGTACTNCDGSSCSTAKTGGTRPTCCTGSQSQHPKSCDSQGQVTCTTTITCKTSNFDNKSCSAGVCYGPTEEVCPLCSNGTSNPDKLTSYICQSSS